MASGYCKWKYSMVCADSKCSSLLLWCVTVSQRFTKLWLCCLRAISFVIVMFLEPKPFSCLTKAFAATPSIHCCVGHLCHFFPATGDAQREDRRLGSLVLLAQRSCFISTCQHCRSHTAIHSCRFRTVRLGGPKLGCILTMSKWEGVEGGWCQWYLNDWKVVGLLLLFYLPQKIEKTTVTEGWRVAG